MPSSLTTPRPLPARHAPTLVGGAVLALALPVFLVAGWRLAGWVLAAVLWVAATLLGILLTRLPLGAANLARSGVVGFGMIFRAVAVMAVVLAVAASDPSLALAAGALYGVIYTLELGLMLTLYFGGEPA